MSRTLGLHVAVQQVIRLGLERDQFDFAAKAALVLQQCAHTNQLAVTFAVPARGHCQDLVQPSVSLVQQPQNDALTQRRDVDHIPNRRADQDTDRSGFTCDARLPDLPACAEVSGRPALRRRAVLTTDAGPVGGSGVLHKADVVAFPPPQHLRVHGVGIRVVAAMRHSLRIPLGIDQYLVQVSSRRKE
jgi:hypothetical protein